jgi:hypothetical protein
MLHKFNLTALTEYSHRFAQQICDEFYAHTSAASGQHILHLTGIPQVNLFVVSSLYEKWTADADAFKSPYFDFENPDVKEALSQFMNVVSRQISVKREHLEPLLASATKDTLVLLLDPSGYYNEVYRNQPNFMLTADAHQKIKKYLRINQFVADTVEAHFGERSFVYVNQAIEWADKAIAENPSQLASVEEWVAKFSEKVPLDSSSLLKKQPKGEPIAVLDPAPNQSFFDSIAPAPTAPPVEVVAPVVSAPEPPKEVVLPPMNPVVTSVNDAVGSSNGSKESLNDTLRTEQATISDAYQNQPITSISQNISLAQKFMFIHQLFSGSNSAYDTAISDLEQAPNFATASDIIKYQLAAKFSWDMTGETVSELLDIVKRRFGG